MNRTETLCSYLANVADTPLDPETEQLARLHLLDTLASIIACRDLDAAVVARRYVSAFAGMVGAGTAAAGPAAGDTSTWSGGATILGTQQRAPVVDAVFASAMTGHGAEINDFIPSVFVQPGPAVVAVALGIGEVTGASLSEVLRAMVAGYELAARVPLALGNNNLRRAGIASHGIGPCFGAAAAAAALLRLPAPRMADVLSLTAQQASGSWQWLLDVAHIEKAFVFAGLGARNGLQAALLVQAGFRGVPDVLDRPDTWFTSKTFTNSKGDGDLDALVDGLGTRSSLPKVAYKRYPVGGPTQPAVEALLDLLPEVKAEAVERVRIEMPGRWEAFRDAEMPALNLRYLSAIILLDGCLDFISAQSLERMHGDADVAALMTRVEVAHDPAQESGPGEARTESARVTIRLSDGAERSRYVPHVVGFPSHPMPSAMVVDKAVALIAPQLGEAGAARLVACCLGDEVCDVAGLVARAGDG